MPHYDKESVAIRPAATVMLIDDRPDLQVLMMQRHVNTTFAGGMWVFPGGSVDVKDDSVAYRLACPDVTEMTASRLMGMKSGGLAYYVAAIRESFEEAGILLARHKQSGEKVTFSEKNMTDRIEAHRNNVNGGLTDFVDVVTKEDLLLDVVDMHYVARWITPIGPPKRFDARFFIARTPIGQTPLHDNRETIHSEWMAPRDILYRFESGEIKLMSPTLRMVKSLALFESTDDAIKAAKANQSDERVRVDPVKDRLLLPGEQGYENASEDIETGWVRLRPMI